MADLPDAGGSMGPDRLDGASLGVSAGSGGGAEEALRASEERFRLASGALAAILFEWDPATNRLEWFGGLEEVLGFRLDEVSPDVAWYESRVHPDDLPRTWESVQAAIENGAPGYANVYRFRHRDGHYVDVLDRARIVRDEAGRPVRVLGGISDISERRRLEREHEALLDREREARAAAEAAARARDDVLRIVSHDLRAPLVAIGIAADTLADGGELRPQSRREIVGLIQRSVDWMHRMIRDLLDVASIEAGHLAVEPHDEAPAALLAQAAEMFAPAARDRGVALDTWVEPDLRAVRADDGRVLQALGNLVTNALTFTERGGRVTLRAERDPGGVRFAVDDTGVGIAADDLPHVFDPLSEKRRHGARRAGGSTGLGLAIVRGIVEAHGGHVRAESTPGLGSRFSFTIPTTS
jgi:PAS domain S-box-containing protein